jgi:hypothetical protein
MMWDAVVQNAGLGTMARVDDARRVSWDIWIIVAFGIIR